jgi:NTE family protein
VSEQDPAGWHAPSDTGASLLADLTDDTQGALLAAATRIHVPAGEWLFRRGDPADAMYILESGRVEVLDGEEPRGRGGAVLRVLGPGSSLTGCAARRSPGCGCMRRWRRSATS